MDGESSSHAKSSLGLYKEDFDGSDVEKEGDNNVSMVPDSVKEDVNVQAEEKGGKDDGGYKWKDVTFLTLYKRPEDEDISLIDVNVVGLLQEYAEKKMPLGLFEVHVISKWDVEVIVMGDLMRCMWIDKPAIVQKSFLEHLVTRFQRPRRIRHSDQYDVPRTIVAEKKNEGDNVRQEIKRAVWDCGMINPPGPDGVTFGFIRRYWSLIEKDVVAAVQHFFTSGNFPKGCNASFIALIPKISEAKFV
ncbi:hypothetical protein Tco_0667211 [Tanacetum coccineum]